MLEEKAHARTHRERERERASDGAEPGKGEEKSGCGASSSNCGSGGGLYLLGTRGRDSLRWRAGGTSPIVRRQEDGDDEGFNVEP
jgi:hypothetical protein